MRSRTLFSIEKFLFILMISVCSSSGAQEMCTINGSSGPCRINAFIHGEKPNDPDAWTCAKLHGVTYEGACQQGYLSGFVVLDRPSSDINPHEKILADVKGGNVQLPYADFNAMWVGATTRTSATACMFFSRNQDQSDRSSCVELKQKFGGEILSRETWQAMRRGTFKLSSLQKDGRVTAGAGSTASTTLPLQSTQLSEKPPAEPPRTTIASNATSMIIDEQGPLDPGNLGIEFSYKIIDDKTTYIYGKGGPCSHLGFNIVRAHPDSVNERYRGKGSIALVKPGQGANLDTAADLRIFGDYSESISYSQKQFNDNRGGPSERIYKENLDIIRCIASSHHQYQDAVYQFHKQNWKKCPGECRPSRLRETQRPFPFSS